jgi:hypothetical protein
MVVVVVVVMVILPSSPYLLSAFQIFPYLILINNHYVCTETNIHLYFYFLCI